MSNISSNKLFHFTKSKKTLISILKNGFYPRFSYNGIWELNDFPADTATPMVSFCDIPLSQIKNHTKLYGNYAIGLTKDWGEKKKINPVSYNIKNSFIAEGLNLISHLHAEYAEKSDYYYMRKHLEKIGFFYKSYSGYLKRNNKYTKEIIVFYNEREWRYVPNPEDLSNAGLNRVWGNTISEERELDFAHKKLEEDFKLLFKPSDIRYIIVKKEKQISGLIKDIDKLYRTEYPEDELNLLKTRLISIEQIEKDF